MHSEFSIYFPWERKNSAPFKNQRTLYELNCRWEFWSEHEYESSFKHSKYKPIPKAE